MHTLPPVIHILTSVLMQVRLQYCIWTRLFTDMHVFHFCSYSTVDLFKEIIVHRNTKLRKNTEGKGVKIHSPSTEGNYIAKCYLWRERKS